MATERAGKCERPAIWIGQGGRGPGGGAHPAVIVVDASVLANVIGDDGPDGNRARREVRAAGDLAAPDLVEVETVAVLRKRWLAGMIADAGVVAAIRDLEDIELDR